MVREACDRLSETERSWGARVEIGVSYKPSAVRQENRSLADFFQILWQQIERVYFPFVRTHRSSEAMPKIVEPLLALVSMIDNLLGILKNTYRDLTLPNPDWLGIETLALLEALIMALVTGESRQLNPYNVLVVRPFFPSRWRELFRGLLRPQQRYDHDDDEDSSHYNRWIPSIRLRVVQHRKVTATMWHLHGGKRNSVKFRRFVETLNRFPLRYECDDEHGEDLSDHLATALWDSFMKLNNKQLRTLDQNRIDNPQQFVNRPALMEYLIRWILQSGRKKGSKTGELWVWLSALLFRLGATFESRELRLAQLERSLSETFPNSLTILRKPGKGRASCIAVVDDQLTAYLPATLLEGRERCTSIVPRDPVEYPATENVERELQEVEDDDDDDDEEEEEQQEEQEEEEEEEGFISFKRQFLLAQYFDNEMKKIQRYIGRNIDIEIVVAWRERLLSLTVSGAEEGGRSTEAVDRAIVERALSLATFQMFFKSTADDDENQKKLLHNLRRRGTSAASKVRLNDDFQKTNVHYIHDGHVFHLFIKGKGREVNVFPDLMEARREEERRKEVE